MLIPARNEASQLVRSLPSVLEQGEELGVIVVDDCSGDDTAVVAEEMLLGRGRVVRGEEPPSGWSGKLWALQQGLRHVDTEFVLLMDADIVLEKDLLPQVISYMRRMNVDFFSLMVTLCMEHPVERLFLPAFVYFFKLLYPFSLSNQRNSQVAAAAGGFIVVRTRLLRQVGAFASMKGALIDDCTLAKRIKALGYRTFMGLTRCAISTRRYKGLGSIWRMVERTAYCQLSYSPVLLLLTTVLMVVCFLVPVEGLFGGSSWTMLVSFSALSIMSVSYVPVLRYYDINPILSVTLPLVASLYLAMTWSSAIRYHFGKGPSWKGRKYKDRVRTQEPSWGKPD